MKNLVAFAGGVVVGAVGILALAVFDGEKPELGISDAIEAGAATVCGWLGVDR